MPVNEEVVKALDKLLAKTHAFEVYTLRCLEEVFSETACYLQHARVSSEETVHNVLVVLTPLRPGC